MKLFILFFTLLYFVPLFSQVKEENQIPQQNINSISISAPSLADSVQVETLQEIKIINNKLRKREEISNSESDFKVAPSASDKFIQKKKFASSQASSRSADILLQNEMDKDVLSLKTQDPNSFNYYLFYYMAGNYNIERENELKKAEKLDPTNPDVLSQSIGNAMVKGDAIATKTYVEKLKGNKLLSEEAISYAEDLILSSIDNQVLVTHGFFDSYGVAFQQYAENFHPELTTISLDLMQSETYRKLVAEKGFLLPLDNIINVHYLTAFCDLNSDKRIALSMTLPKEYLLPLKESLFPIGLVFEYRNSGSHFESNDVERNAQLWNQILLKENINAFSSSESNNLSSNYLPMLIFLKSAYELNKEPDKFERIEKALDFTARKSGKLSLLKKQ